MGGLTGGIGGSQGFSPLSFLGGFGLGGLMGGMMGGGMGMMGGLGGGMLPMMMMGGMSMLPLMMMMGGMFNQGQQAGLGGGYGGGYGGGINPMQCPAGYGGYGGGYGGCVGGYGYGGGLPGGFPGEFPGYPSGYSGGYPGGNPGYGFPPGTPGFGGGGYPSPIQSGGCCCDPQCGGGNQFPPQGSGELNNNTQNKTVSYTDSNGYKITTNYSSPQYPTVTVQGPNGQTLVSEDGDPHEQLGQGVQDQNNGAEGNWTQNNRQLILPDGTVVSMNANGASGAGAGINGVTIVDPNGQQAVQETGLNSGNPDVQETNNPYLIGQDANSINYTNAAALGQGPNGQYTFEQLQSRSLPVGPAPGGDGDGDGDGGAQPQQNKPGAPLWSWLLCPPAALGYDVVEHAGVGAGIDNFFGSVGSGISNFFTHPI